jgi:xanthine dehydrogenase accessory factor
MKELYDIIAAYDKAVLQNKKAALVTVVQVDGSSYRRPGARMLVTDDGMMTGAISGGCLEGDALQKALFAISTGENKLITYDSTDENDIQFGLHLGCNGVVYILFEPVKKEEGDNPVELLRRIAESGEDAVLVTFFSQHKTQPGTGILYLKNEMTGPHSYHLPGSFADQIQKVYAGKEPVFADLVIGNTPCTAFIEYVDRPVSVVIAGAGNDVQPLVEIASMLGWRVTVVDGRFNYALAGRFPKAVDVFPGKPADILPQLKTDSRTVFLLMSHNYNYDLAFLQEILTAEFGYIGLLGPAQKRNRMLADLADQGIHLDENILTKIHGPVGLDIGAEHATEIALSIIAEIKAFLSGRSGASLKLKKTAIHHRHQRVTDNPSHD